MQLERSEIGQHWPTAMPKRSMLRLFSAKETPTRACIHSDARTVTSHTRRQTHMHATHTRTHRAVAVLLALGLADALGVFLALAVDGAVAAGGAAACIWGVSKDKEK